MVDTGSVGLRVFAGAISVSPASGVQLESHHDSIQTLDGTVWSGTVGTATLRLAGIATTTPVPFQLIISTRCDPNPLGVSCIGGGDANSLKEVGAEGILGIGLAGPTPGSPVTNPLLSLPAPYGRAWALDMTNAFGDGSGQLILGAGAFPHPILERQRRCLA